MPVTRFCSNCQCFKVLGKANELIGRCHRRPPVLIPPSQIPHVVTSERWEWPVVRASGYCWEHIFNEEGETK